VLLELHQDSHRALRQPVFPRLRVWHAERIEERRQNRIRCHRVIAHFHAAIEFGQPAIHARRNLDDQPCREFLARASHGLRHRCNLVEPFRTVIPLDGPDRVNRIRQTEQQRAPRGLGRLPVKIRLAEFVGKTFAPECELETDFRHC